MRKKVKFNLSRVDVQVSLFAAIAVGLSCFVLFWITYDFTYKDMIYTLEQRVESIVTYVEEERFDLTAFDDINDKSDITAEKYIAMKEMFGEIRKITNAKYLYTAKENEDGALIYLIDGLPMDDPDFRYPGDLIEPDFQADLRKALNGQRVMPNEILDTDWGDVFVAYVPVHNADDEIIGAIGVEFSAENQYKTFQLIRQVTPLIIGLSCIVCAIFSVIYFRRISNPRYKDLANTDYLTSLKSRNAYEVDINNRASQHKLMNLGVISTDLNGLKKINDSKGHEQGDEYLKCYAETLRRVCTKNEISYRIGGDEFIVLVENATNEKMEELIMKIEMNFKETAENFEDAAYSIGYAICRDNKIDSWQMAVKEADQNMYNAKKEYYSNKNNI
ncbi:GGDEF domain-containing protein [Anaerorhabdus sp.]|uniref:GGDEF domain-containing protein n=1 Tax=Anaerorhabdus sp. TaxID=1872524 RepID=UPI002FC612F0